MSEQKTTAISFTQDEAKHVLEIIGHGIGVQTPAENAFRDAIQTGDEVLFQLGRVAGLSNDSLEREYPTLLGFACCANKLEFAQAIIDDGHDVNKTNMFGRTAAYEVVDHPEIRDKSGSIIWGGLNGKIAALKLLHKNGAQFVFTPNSVIRSRSTVYLNSLAEERGEQRVANAIVAMLGGDPRPAAIRPAARAGAGVKAHTPAV